MQALAHQHHASLLEFAMHHRDTLQLRQKRFERGAHLFVPHDDKSCVYVIRSGTLRVSIPANNGAQVFLADLHGGDIVGEVSAISGEREPTIVEAVEDTETFVFSRAAFLEVLKQCPEGAFQVMHTLCQRLRSLNQRHSENVSLPMAARLAIELMRLAKKAESGQLVIAGAPTHIVLADRIGSHREAVTKELRYLARRGVLGVRRGHITILDPGRLMSERRRT